MEILRTAVVVWRPANGLQLLALSDDGRDFRGESLLVSCAKIMRSLKTQ
jgi:hypothetical protein